MSGEMNSDGTPSPFEFATVDYSDELFIEPDATGFSGELLGPKASVVVAEFIVTSG